MKLTRAAVCAPQEAAQAHRRSARRPWWIAGLAAGSVALTAAAVPAVALATGASVVYHACVTNATGAIKIVSASATCAASQHKISWNNQGLRGPRGLQGLQGLQGLPGVTTGYSYFSSTDLSLPQGSLNAAEVGGVQLPAGTFIVNFSAGAYGFARDTVFCTLHDSGDSSPIDEADATLALDPTGYAAASLAMSTVTTSGGTVSVDCESGSGTGSIFDVSITAIPLSNLAASPAGHSARLGHWARPATRRPLQPFGGAA